MQKSLVTIALSFMLLLALPGPAPVGAQSPGDGVVHAVLFYSPSCQHCHYVMEVVLPPLANKYGKQLEILNVDASQQGGYILYQQAVEQFKIPDERAGVPALIVGDVVLVGSEEIPQQFPGLIEKYLAEGGVDWPAIPGLAAMTAGASTSELTFESDPLGHTVSIAVLTGMVIAIIYSAMLLSRQGRARLQPGGVQPERLKHWIIPLLGVVGLIVASYLSFVETTHTAAVCGPVGDCNAVQASPYSLLFGFLPLAVLGLLGYLVVLAFWGWAAFGSGRTAELAALGMVGAALFGTVFSTYLTYLEPFVIHAVCVWCLASAAAMTGLMLSSTWLLFRPAQPLPHRRRR
jgi:uncharacterized membrane protein